MFCRFAGTGVVPETILRRMVRHAAGLPRRLCPGDRTRRQGTYLSGRGTKDEQGAPQGRMHFSRRPPRSKNSRSRRHRHRHRDGMHGEFREISRRHGQIWGKLPQADPLHAVDPQHHQLSDLDPAEVPRIQHHLFPQGDIVRKRPARRPAADKSGNGRQRLSRKPRRSHPAPNMPSFPKPRLQPC